MTCNYENANYLVSTAEPVSFIANDHFPHDPRVLADWFKEESEARDQATEWLARTTAKTVVMIDLSCSRIHVFELALRESLPNPEQKSESSGLSEQATEASPYTHGSLDAESEAR